MSTPDIRVRLTTEGVKQVIDGIRQVQAEARKAEATTKQWSQTMASARGALAAFGVGASLAGIVAYGKSVLRSAEESSNAAKQLGLTTEEFTRLGWAAKSADVETSSLTEGLSAYQAKLSKAMTDPTSEAAEAFTQLGLNAKQLSKLGLVDQIRQIADRIADLKNPADRSRAASELFSKSLGPGFARVLAEGSAGLAQFADESDRLGYTLRTDTAEQLDKTSESFKRMKATLAGWSGTAFAAITSNVTWLAESVAAAVNGPAFDDLARLQARVVETQAFIEKLQNLGWAGRLFYGGADGVKSTIEGQKKQLADFQRLFDAAKAAAAPVAAPPDKQGELEVNRVSKLAKATLDAQRAGIQEQARGLAEAYRNEEDAAKRSYDRGLSSVQEYYQRRRQLVEAALSAETIAADAQVDLIRRAPIQGEDGEAKAMARAAQTREIEKIYADLALKRIQSQRELAGLRDDEIVEQKKLSDDSAQFQTKLLELEGDRHAVFMANLKKEIEERRKLGAQQGTPAAEVEADVQRLTRARTVANDFQEVVRAGQEQLNAFDRDAAQIQRDQQSGVISQLEGEQRLIALQRERITVLQELAAAAMQTARATGDQEAIRQAEAYVDSVKEIAATLRAATDLTGKFRQGFDGGVRDGFRDLTDGALQGKIKSLGDAFSAVADSVNRAMGRIIADIASQQLQKALNTFIGWIGGILGPASTPTGAGVGNAGFLSSPLRAARNGGELQRLRGGGIVDARGGGMLFGPGTPTSDSMLLLGSTKEFMVRAMATQQPGGLRLLHALNTGKVKATELLAGMEALRHMRLNVPRFALGGPLSGNSPLSPITPGAGMPPGISLTQHNAPGVDAAALHAYGQRLISEVRAIVADDASRGRGLWGRG